MKTLEEKQGHEFQEFKKHELAYAKAASLDLKTRQHAQKVKKIFSQLRKFPLCPYCQNDLGNTPHADHIYPVAKGGLSTIENMVYICAGCNRMKSDLTLREFILKYNLERDEVEKILEKLSSAHPEMGIFRSNKNE
ncbi:MAG: HNH endonuclease [bacterium]|nr:HNH endonuclease [bacterium]